MSVATEGLRLSTSEAWAEQALRGVGGTGDSAPFCEGPPNVKVLVLGAGEF